MSNNTVRDFVDSIRWGNSLVPNAELIFSVYEGAEFRTPANIAGLAASNRHHYRFLRNYSDDLLLMQIMRFNYSQRVPKNLRYNLVAILNNSHSHCETLADAVQTFPYSEEEWAEEKVHMSRDYIIDLIDTRLVNISIIPTDSETGTGTIHLKSKVNSLEIVAPFSSRNQELDDEVITFLKKYGGKHLKNYLAQV